MTPLTAAGAVFTYLRDFSDSIALLPGAKRFDFGHVRGVFTGRAMFNRFYDATYPPIVTADDVATLAGVALEQNCRPVWLFDTDGIGPAVAGALEANGFVQKATWSGMWRSAEDLPRVDPPQGVTVTRVDDSVALLTWVRICVEVEDFSPAQGETFRELFQTLRDQDAPWTHLIASIDGRAVATASLFLTNRIAAVDWVNTLPDARRRGTASHLVSRLLSDAAGTWDVAVLTSTADGESLYRRLGFRHCAGVAAYRLSSAL